MTERARPGRYGDYLHVLAVRVLSEELLLQPRREGLFETEFAGPADIEQLPPFTIEASQTQKTMPSAIDRKDAPAAGSATVVPPQTQSVGPLHATRPTRIEPSPATTVTRIEALKPQPGPAAGVQTQAMERWGEIDPRVVSRDDQSPPLPKTALLAAQEVHVRMPPPLLPPARPVPYNAAASPAVRTARIEASVSASVVAPGGSRRREPPSGVMVAHAVPEIRNLTPLFPPSSHIAKEPPSVEITIGRLELRATAAKAPAASPRSIAPSPRHTLQEYLTRKTRGHT